MNDFMYAVNRLNALLGQQDNRLDCLAYHTQVPCDQSLLQRSDSSGALFKIFREPWLPDKLNTCLKSHLLVEKCADSSVDHGSCYLFLSSQQRLVEHQIDYLILVPETGKSRRKTLVRP